MTIVAFAWVTAAFLFLIGLMQHERRVARQERDQILNRWMADRKDLLDRIQAPSFQEYAGKVIREKKADHPPDDKEKPVEFIS